MRTLLNIKTSLVMTSVICFCIAYYILATDDQADCYNTAHGICVTPATQLLLPTLQYSTQLRREFSFSICNKSDSTRRIEYINSSCGCTGLRDALTGNDLSKGYVFNILPGELREFIGIFTPSARVETKLVTLRFSDITNGMPDNFEVKAIVEVMEIYTFMPRLLQTDSSAPAADHEVYLTIRSEGMPVFEKILRTEIDNKSVLVKSIECIAVNTAASWKEYVYKLIVHSDTSSIDQEMQCICYVHTPLSRPAVLPINLSVRHTVSVIPHELCFYHTVETHHKRRLIVRSRAGDKFNVSSVQCNVTGFAYTIQQAEPGSMCLIEVVFPSNSKEGQCSMTIVTSIGSASCVVKFLP